MNLDAFSSTQFEPWWWEWAPRPSRNDVELPSRVDVVVVGSGYTGLMAALTLARGGLDVAVLEAETIGYGASSRNGGQVGSGNQRSSVAALKSRFGVQAATALLKEGVAALDFVKAFIEAEGIECHFRAAGRFRGASHPAHYEAMARDMEDLHATAGVEAHMVSRSQQRDEIGTDLFYGGCVLPADASVHPALYHAGLVERVESAGGRLFSHACVIGIDDEKDGAVVRTQRGDVFAREVLVATNGYTTKTTPGLYQRIVPVGSAIIATVPLSPNLMAHLMPRHRVFGDTARVHHYFQPTPDGERILFGSRMSGRPGSQRAKDYVHLQRDLVRLFPELDGVDITHAWSGYVAYTQDVLPHLGKHEHTWYAMGYCGSGVARASHAGQQIALRMLGRAERDCAWGELEFSPMPFRRFAPLGVAAAVHWKRLLDRVG